MTDKEKALQERLAITEDRLQACQVLIEELLLPALTAAQRASYLKEWKKPERNCEERWVGLLLDMVQSAGVVS